MKDKITQILNEYRENVSNDSSISKYAIEERYFNELANEIVEKLFITDVGFSETEVCEYCDGDKWISEGVRDVPCPSCGCTGVKQT